MLLSFCGLGFCGTATTNLLIVACIGYILEKRTIFVMEIAINSWFNHLFDSWFAQHPNIYWLIEHPWLSASVTLILIIFVVRLLVAIYRLVINTIDRLWLWIMRSPLLLLKWLFGWEFKPKQQPNSLQVINKELTGERQELKIINQRLDLIQQQQQQILEEITQLRQSQLPKLALPTAETITTK